MRHRNVLVQQVDRPRIPFRQGRQIASLDGRRSWKWVARFPSGRYQRRIAKSDSTIDFDGIFPYRPHALKHVKGGHQDHQNNACCGKPEQSAGR